MHFHAVLFTSVLTVLHHALGAPNPQLLSGLTGVLGAGVIGSSGADTIGSALDMVKSSIDSLDTTVKAVNSPSISQLAPLATKGQAVGNTIKQAQTMIDGAQRVDLIGALQLNQKAQGLTTSTNNLANDLIAKKPLVQMVGLTSAVSQMVQMQQTSSAGLIKSVIAKLPQLAQGIAQQQTQGVSQALDRVVQAYSQGSNSTTPAASMSASPTAASGAPSGAPSTAPSATASRAPTVSATATPRKHRRRRNSLKHRAKRTHQEQRMHREKRLHQRTKTHPAM